MKSVDEKEKDKVLNKQALRNIIVGLVLLVSGYFLERIVCYFTCEEADPFEGTWSQIDDLTTSQRQDTEINKHDDGSYTWSYTTITESARIDHQFNGAVDEKGNLVGTMTRLIKGDPNCGTIKYTVSMSPISDTHQLDVSYKPDVLNGCISEDDGNRMWTRIVPRDWGPN